MTGYVKRAYNYLMGESENISTKGAAGGDIVDSVPGTEERFTPNLEDDDVDSNFASISLLSNDFKYKMDHRRRGKFIIINNKTFLPSTGMNERSGTDKDAASLHEIFKKYGFEVTLYNNRTKDQMLDIMLQASKEDHSDCDCFGVAVLSHGDSDVLYGTDSIIAIDNFTAPIKKCKTLVEKPKLFFFQACRGNELDSGMQASDAIGDSGKRNTIVIPMEADVLYAYSTVPGYFSWRNSSKGSWFVQALYQVLKNPDCEKLDFVKVLTRVSNVVSYQFESNASRPEMNQKKQVPSIVSMLTRDLYLLPKQK